MHRCRDRATAGGVLSPETYQAQTGNGLYVFALP